MNKLTIITEITKEKYSRTVNYKGKIYKEEFVKTDFGAQGTGVAIEDQKGLPAILKENLDDPYELMKNIK